MEGVSDILMAVVKEAPSNTNLATVTGALHRWEDDKERVS
jgi:hypothetical protein